MDILHRVVGEIVTAPGRTVQGRTPHTAGSVPPAGVEDWRTCAQSSNVVIDVNCRESHSVMTPPQHERARVDKAQDVVHATLHTTQHCQRDVIYLLVL